MSTMSRKPGPYAHMAIGITCGLGGGVLSLFIWHWLPVVVGVIIMTYCAALDAQHDKENK